MPADQGEMSAAICGCSGERYRRLSRMKLYALALCAVALLAGCAPKKDPKPNVSLTLPTLAPAPVWTLKDVAGNPVNFADFKGKVVVVDFWATWCPPCRAEIPGYIDLYKKYGKDKLVIVGVSMDDGTKVVSDFVKKFGVTYPVVMADDATVAAFGGMDAIPTTFLIDRNGQIRDKKVGAESKDEYERKIASLLD